MRDIFVRIYSFPPKNSRTLKIARLLRRNLHENVTYGPSQIITLKRKKKNCHNKILPCMTHLLLRMAIFIFLISRRIGEHWPFRWVRLLFIWHMTCFQGHHVVICQKEFCYLSIWPNLARVDTPSHIVPVWSVFCRNGTMMSCHDVTAQRKSQPWIENSLRRVKMSKNYWMLATLLLIFYILPFVAQHPKPSLYIS